MAMSPNPTHQPTHPPLSEVELRDATTDLKPGWSYFIQ
jgi:hypothetical protein